MRIVGKSNYDTESFLVASYETVTISGAQAYSSMDFPTPFVIENHSLIGIESWLRQDSYPIRLEVRKIKASKNLCFCV